MGEYLKIKTSLINEYSLDEGDVDFSFQVDREHGVTEVE
jgi:hypothetical protein